MRVRKLPTLLAGVLAATTLVACSDSSTDGISEPAAGVSFSYLDGADGSALQCAVIGFEQFTPGDDIRGDGTLGVTIGSDDYSFSVASSNVGITGTGEVTVYDSNGSGEDPDLEVGGTCASCSGNVLILQEKDDADATTPDGPDDSDTGGLVTFTLYSGSAPLYIGSWDGIDQEATQGESITLYIDGAATGSVTSGLGDGTVETLDLDPAAEFSTSFGYLFTGSGAVDDIQVCAEVERGAEGCTPGYWKQAQHFGNWPVELDVGFCDVFTSGAGISLERPESGSLCDETLLSALSLRGGGVNALARHAVSAYLNALSSVEYFYSDSEIVDGVNAALDAGDYESTKDDLAMQNESYCPLGRAPAD